MRSLRLVPSEDEVARLVSECCTSHATLASKAEVRECIERFAAISTHSLSASELKQTMYIFDAKGTRKIPANEFRTMLQSDAFGGDAFSEAELALVLQQLNVGPADDVPIDALVDVFDKRSA